jgi:hypothetical protein
MVPFTINYSDLAGNSQAQVTGATDGSSVTFDNTAPSLTSVHIASNNGNSSWARVGSVVTLSFTATEAIQTPNVTVGTQAATVSGGPSVWTAAYTTMATDAEGIMPFAINFSDLAGNAGGQVTGVTDGSSVTLDKTPPVVTISAPSPAGPVDGTATVSFQVTYSDNFVLSNPVLINLVIFNVSSGASASRASVSGNNPFTVTLSNFTGNGTVSMSMPGVAMDLAGNISAPVTSSPIRVIPTPAFLSAVPLNGSLVFTWSAVSGIGYQLQHTPNLNPINWANVGGLVTPTNTVGTTSDTFGPNPEGYYRLIVAP